MFCPKCGVRRRDFFTSPAAGKKTFFTNLRLYSWGNVDWTGCCGLQRCKWICWFWPKNRIYRRQLLLSNNWFCHLWRNILKGVYLAIFSETPQQAKLKNIHIAWHITKNSKKPWQGGSSGGHFPIYPLGQRFQMPFHLWQRGFPFNLWDRVIVRAPPVLAGPEFGVRQQARRSPPVSCPTARVSQAGFRELAISHRPITPPVHPPWDISNLTLP